MRGARHLLCALALARCVDVDVQGPATLGVRAWWGVETVRCADSSSAASCAQWAADGQCAANPAYMLQECRAACGAAHCMGRAGCRARHTAHCAARRCTLRRAPKHPSRRAKHHSWG